MHVDVALNGLDEYINLLLYFLALPTDFQNPKSDCSECLLFPKGS